MEIYQPMVLRAISKALGLLELYDFTLRQSEVTVEANRYGFLLRNCHPIGDQQSLTRETN